MRAALSGPSARASSPGDGQRAGVRKSMASKSRIGAVATGVVAMASLVWAADRGGHLNYSHRQNLSAYDPITASDVATTQFSSTMFEQLLERKKVGTGVKCRMCKEFKLGDK